MVAEVRARLWMLIVLIVVACGGFLQGFWSVDLTVGAGIEDDMQIQVLIMNLITKLWVGIERAAIYTFIVGVIILIGLLLDWVVAEVRTLISQPPSEINPDQIQVIRVHEKD